MTDIVIPGHEILNLIGEGGMAQVYAGARFGVGNSIKPVAVKVIRPELSADPRFREMLLSEGRTSMKFNHGNIVTVFDVGEVDGQLYMIMDWVDGVSLKQFAHTLLKKRDQPLDLSLVLSIAIQLLCALHYAHNYKVDRKKKGIVHRDVTPYNVMVSSSGEIKLLDFGVARIAGGRTTRSMKGNLVYMPREQAQGNPRVESDIYAVGALIFELIEGERFRSHCETEDDVLRDIFEGSVPELRRPDVPEELRDLLRDMLAVSWADRPHSAVEVIKRIDKLPIKLFSSPIEIQELYERYFGEPHSGLTRFAHRDPELWVDHMRKLGKDRARDDAQKWKLESDAPQERSGDASPRTLLQPRAHAEVRLHRAMDEGSDPFEVQTTARFKPCDTPIANDEKPSAAADAAEVRGDGAMGDEAQREGARDRGRGEEQPEAKAEPKREPTVRRPPPSFTATGPARDAGPRELAPAMGMFTRMGWVSRTFGGTVQGVVPWRDLLAGPFGLLLLATFTFGAVVPIACQVSLPKAEVRR
ncbi:serine/threonine-protein kinase [Paraliomyxa miuraensis]|uniref:serine/threonine-protein kinase n=1 Tax=Paraliomyxa miuraensis TaxID=376150 RepID=UPI0022551314|nr:serine/threonine protein kinase [Paraliomyxa miuraensis]MCX4239117.1 protein kinase [Paraliomyxa miuraensis]